MHTVLYTIVIVLIMVLKPIRIIHPTRIQFFQHYFLIILNSFGACLFEKMHQIVLI